MREQLTRPTVRNGIIIIGLLIFRFIHQFLPGIDIIIIQPDITVSTLLYSLITVFIFATIIRYATTVGTVLSRNYDHISSLEKIIQLSAVLIITAWAYSTFWWLPYFRNNPSQYDLLFLIIGVIIIAWLGYLLYDEIDEITDILMNSERISNQIEHDDDKSTEGK